MGQVTAAERVTPATTDGQHQFKMRRNYCQQWSKLGLKN